MATDTDGGTLASSVQRTILGILLLFLWYGLGATAMEILGNGLVGMAAVILISVVISVLIVGLLVEGIREGQTA